MSLWLWAGGQALAQRSPFAVGAPEAPVGAASGWLGWILERQAEFYRGLTGAVRASAHDPAAFWTLAGLCFAYGVFHAAGPGHGKAVIASWIVASERTLRRGLALTAAAAALQALIAIAIVGVGALVFNVTAPTMTRAAEWVEYGAFAAIFLVGLALMRARGATLAAALRRWRQARTALAVADVGPMRAPSGAGAGLSMRFDAAPATGAKAARFSCDAVGAGEAAPCATCGFSHAPDPTALAGPLDWRQTVGVVVAAGARPCSGAILVLVFALSQRAFWAGVGGVLAMGAGVALTTGALAGLAVYGKKIAERLTRGRGPGAEALLRALEFAAAVGVVLFGALLFAAVWFGVLA